MKALITGGAGFVGSHLAEHLRSIGIEVSIFDINHRKRYFDFKPQDFNFIQGNILNKQSLNQAAHDCDVIFHLAGVLGTDYLLNFPELAVQTNIVGTINVLNASLMNNATVIYMSLLPQWNNSYMITKNTAEHFCTMYRDEFGAKTIILKASHIYGGRQKWFPVEKAVPCFILAALENKPISIYGSGTQLMDLIHVKDVVCGLGKCIGNQQALGKVIDLGSGNGIPVSNVAERIKSLSFSKSNIIHIGKRPGEPDNANSFTPADTTKLISVLNFTTEVGLDAGLLETIEWYRTHVTSKRGVIR